MCTRSIGWGTKPWNCSSVISRRIYFLARIRLSSLLPQPWEFLRPILGIAPDLVWFWSTPGGFWHISFFPVPMYLVSILLSATWEGVTPATLALCASGIWTDSHVYPPPASRQLFYFYSVYQTVILSTFKLRNLHNWCANLIWDIRTFILWRQFFEYIWPRSRDRSQRTALNSIFFYVLIIMGIF